MHKFKVNNILKKLDSDKIVKVKRYAPICPPPSTEEDLKGIKSISIKFCNCPSTK